MKNKKIIIIGAGPAGLTAAYEILEKTDFIPYIYELDSQVGGISRTIDYKGNKIDIGGHRFFSKSERVMSWWKNILPVQGFLSCDDKILNRNIPLSNKKRAPNPEKEDRVFLFRNRLSRIFFLQKFFDYPITLKVQTVKNLGFIRIIKIGFTYIQSRFFIFKKEKNLEDFFIKRFGSELYKTFFRDYTEKLWGISCEKIKPEWGKQRIKGLSVSKAIIHAVKNIFSRKKTLEQKKVETSLIEQFLYPKFGPGQMWEEVANLVEKRGGKIFLKNEIVNLDFEKDKIIAIKTKNLRTGKEELIEGDYFFSTMPMKDLILRMNLVPEKVKNIAKNLQYRDFMTVGLLVKKLEIENQTDQKSVNNIISDNWLYIQEKEVKMGRIQIFNNWSPYMVKDENTVWIGLEYFVNEDDEFWKMSDENFIKFAISEMEKLNMLKKENVLDSTIIRQKKAYPAYFGDSYDQLDTIKDFTNKISNLFLIGRNGMHRYNNQDHSMLSAMVAVENLIAGKVAKQNIWDTNVEGEYHEVL